MSVKTQTESLSVAGTTTAAVEVPALSNPRLSGMVVVTGSPVYTVKYSLDGINYLPLGTDLTSQSTSQDFTVVFPIKDLKVSFDSGTGTVKLIVRADFGGF